MKTEETTRGMCVEHVPTGTICYVVYAYADDETLGVDVGTMGARHVLPAAEFRPFDKETRCERCDDLRERCACDKGDTWYAVRTVEGRYVTRDRVSVVDHPVLFPTFEQADNARVMHSWPKPPTASLESYRKHRGDTFALSPVGAALPEPASAYAEPRPLLSSAPLTVGERVEYGWTGEIRAIDGTSALVLVTDEDGAVTHRDWYPLTLLRRASSASPLPAVNALDTLKQDLREALDALQELAEVDTDTHMPDYVRTMGRVDEVLAKHGRGQ